MRWQAPTKKIIDNEIHRFELHFIEHLISTIKNFHDMIGKHDFFLPLSEGQTVQI